MCINGKPFLDEPYSFAFSINVDWFQPFKHTTDSVGAIYLSILNIPRTECYKILLFVALFLDYLSLSLQ